MPRVMMTLVPSRQQRRLLLIGYLLLLWPVAGLIEGVAWGGLLPCWGLGLWLAWRRLRLPPGYLLWDGHWLVWQGGSYQLGARSCILPGMLWLQLQAAGRSEIRLWLFADALAQTHYRMLARAIGLGRGSAASHDQ